MADLDAFSCSNAWVYVRWETLPATVTRLDLFRRDLTAGGGETNVMPNVNPAAAAPADHLTGLSMVAPGTPGSSTAVQSSRGRHFPIAFPAGGSFSFRLLANDPAGLVTPVTTANIDVDPSLAGVNVGWRPFYPPAGGPLWLEMSNSEAPKPGWELVSAFNETDAANVTFPYKQWGYFLDQSADSVTRGHRLRYRLHITDPVAGNSDKTVELVHQWHFPAQLAFFIDNRTLPFEFLVRDGGNLVPYFDHFVPFALPRPWSLCVATRYDHPAAGANPKSYYYLTHTNDHAQSDRFIPIAEGANGLVATVARDFGGHHVSHSISTLTTLLVPQVGSVGYAWGTTDSPENSLFYTNAVGNRRALMYVGPYPGSFGDNANITRDVGGTFAHEYQHLNYHRGYIARTGIHNGNTSWDQDRSLDEGCGFFAEDVVNSFNYLFWRGAMTAQDSFENLFLMWAWPNGTTYQLYARGALWVMYNLNRLRARNGMLNHTSANAPRGGSGTFATFYREFTLTVGLNEFMPDDADLDLKGHTASDGTANKLKTSFRRKFTGAGSDYLVKTQRLKEWSIPPHKFADGSTPAAALPWMFESVDDLNARALILHYGLTMTVRHSSAFIAQFTRSPDGWAGSLHVELNIVAANPGSVRKVAVVARRIGDGTGAAEWEHKTVNNAVDTLVQVPDFGTRIDHVRVFVPTETKVPVATASLAAALSDAIPWVYYATRLPDPLLVGVQPEEVYRGGTNVLRYDVDGTTPTTYLGPGRTRSWVHFNQGMELGAHFQVRYPTGEHAIDRDSFAKALNTADLWRSTYGVIAAATQRDGQAIHWEIGRATRTGATITGGVKSFAGVYLDRRDDHRDTGALVSDKRWGAVLDTRPPTIQSVNYVNGNGTAGAMANGLNLVGVMSLEVAARDTVSGIGTMELIGRSRGTPDVYTIGRRVMVPNPADGELAHDATEKFFWNTSAAVNGPVDFEIVVGDRVGNLFTRRFDGAVIRNPRPGVQPNTPNLAPGAGAAPTLAITTSQCDGGTGAWANLAANGPARGKLKFHLDGSASTANAQLMVKATTATSAVAREIWSEWLVAGGAVAKDWEFDGRALPDGTVTLSFTLTDEAAAVTAAVTFAFVAANRPPRIIPRAPRLATRGIVDTFVYADDRCTTVIDPGACEAHWEVGGVDAFTVALAPFPGGSFFRRAGVHPTAAPATGFADGKVDLKLKAGAVNLLPVPLLFLHRIGHYHPLPGRVARVTTFNDAEPTLFGEITCAAEYAVLAEGTTKPKVRFYIKGEAAVAVGDVVLTFAADGGAGNVTLGAVADEGGGVFAAEASAADGKQGKGVLTVQATDAVGNVARLELPLWVVKQPLADKADLHVRYTRAVFTTNLRSTEQHVVRLAGDGAAPQYVPANVTIDARLRELGLHFEEVKVLWRPTGGGADVDLLVTLVRSNQFAEGWETTVDLSTAGVADGAGKIVFKFKDHSGNVGEQEFDGWTLDSTAPTATVQTVTTPGNAVSITLNPPPTDNGSGVEKTVLHLTRQDVDTAGGNTFWWYLGEYTGPFSLPYAIFPAGNYQVRVKMMDKVGNQPAADVTGPLTVT